jgi:hypothetical protein
MLFQELIEQHRVYCVLSYARQRAGYASTEIRLLDAEWNVLEVILPQAVLGLV